MTAMQSPALTAEAPYPATLKCEGQCGTRDSDGRADTERCQAAPVAFLDLPPFAFGWYCEAHLKRKGKPTAAPAFDDGCGGDPE